MTSIIHELQYKSSGYSLGTQCNFETKSSTRQFLKFITCTSFVLSVQIFPCDSKPCVNGATCSNDDQDVSLYHCHCTDNYSGKNCQGTEVF